MKKAIALDCREMKDRDSLHTYLAQMLEFPAWYGRNLDALFDLLTELGPPRLVLDLACVLEEGEPYGRAVLETLRDAADSNPHLELTVLF